jgi:two-component SAPR family response regulator
MFVRWRDGAFHPYRALARCPRPIETSSTSVLIPFAVRLFGSPSVTYDNRMVAWIRRRDAHIFAFLALQPNGRASRQTLLRAFWPDSERHLGGQNLRSACSTMRRALAEVVGYAGLAHYITFGDEIALNLALFAVDARSVRAHVRDADAAWAAGADAAGHDLDRAALAFAAGPFLNGDVPPALEGVGAELVAHLARCRSRAERVVEALSPAV